jgi:phosphoglycerate dehydrogenase-like enzyme
VTDTIRALLGPIGGSLIYEQLATIPDLELTAAASIDEVPDLIGDAEVLISFRWSDEWVVPGLRWIQSVSAGTDQFPLDALRANGTVLTSASGVHEIQVSEHAIGLLLAMTRGIAASARDQHLHQWQWPPVADLSGMTLGILGLGTIGEGVARRASGFGMRVIGTKRDPGTYSGVAVEVYPPQETVEVCRAADAVIITLPGGDGTRDIVGLAELEALEGGWLVNVGRGSVIDTAALLDVAGRGLLRGVALDVFEEEPLPKDSPLWDTPGILITPHVAGLSPGYGERLAAIVARNIAAYRGDGEWVNRVV